VLDSSTFFYGLEAGKEANITIEEGKTLIVKLLAIGELQPDGTRAIFYELNGRRRVAVAHDRGSGIQPRKREKADPADAGQLGAPMAGKVVEISVSAGDRVVEGQKLLTTEAMKMINVIKAPRAGIVARVLVQKGDDLLAGDLICEVKAG
jgi:pyruvate carboxylase